MGTYCQACSLVYPSLTSAPSITHSLSTHPSTCCSSAPVHHPSSILTHPLICCYTQPSTIACSFICLFCYRPICQPASPVHRGAPSPPSFTHLLSSDPLVFITGHQPVRHLLGLFLKPETGHFRAVRLSLKPHNWFQLRSLCLQTDRK